MANFVIVAVLLLVIGLAAGYVVRAKRSGRKCIGCPESGNPHCSCHRGA